MQYAPCVMGMNCSLTYCIKIWVHISKYCIIWSMRPIFELIIACILRHNHPNLPLVLNLQPTTVSSAIFCEMGPDPPVWHPFALPSGIPQGMVLGLLLFLLYLNNLPDNIQSEMHFTVKQRCGPGVWSHSLYDSSWQWHQCNLADVCACLWISLERGPYTLLDCVYNPGLQVILIEHPVKCILMSTWNHTDSGANWSTGNHSMPRSGQVKVYIHN